ncbi:MAG: Abi family protein [Spirochaetales bacterium]|nr:Abi family protein [Spirochaetales bacterium]
MATILKSAGLFLLYMTDKIPFNKPALSISQQISKMESRGMIILDKDLAKTALMNLNYYRLSGYWMYFEDCREPHHFRTGTRFEDVLELYDFERILRAKIFEGISRVEVSVRTQFVHQTAIRYGSHFYLNPKYAKDFSAWLENMKKIQTEVGRSKEIFIKHYKEKYEESFPPIWVVCETFSFGNLSCWYKNLKEILSENQENFGNAKDAIASFYKVPSLVFESWLHSLSVLRNHCAHQSRVILKQIAIQPMKPKSCKNILSSLWKQDSNCLYNLILILVYLNNQIDLDQTWKKDFIHFLKDNSSKCIEFLCFPQNWEKDLFWNELTVVNIDK